MSLPPFALQPPTREYYPVHPQQHHDPDPSRAPRPASLSTTTAPSATSLRRGDDEDDAADASSSSLLADLRYQVEFYFSEKNLRHDAYLRSLLFARDHPGMVPVATIASFPRVRKIYAMHKAGEGGRYRYLRPDEATAPADPAAVVRSLRNSNVVQVSDDGHWLRPCCGAGPSPATTTTEDWGGGLEASAGRGPKDFSRVTAITAGGGGPALSVSVDTKATSTLSSTTTSPSVTPTSFDSAGGADAAVFAGSSSSSPSPSNQFSETPATGGAVETFTALPPQGNAVPSTVSMTTTTPRRGNSSAATTAQAEATAVPMHSHPYLGTQQPQQYVPVLVTAAAYQYHPPVVAAGAYPGVPLAYLYPPPAGGPGPVTQAQPFSPEPQGHSPPQPHSSSSSPPTLQQGYAVQYPAPSASHQPQQGYVAASPTMMADAAAAMAAAVHVQPPPQAAAERESVPWAHPPQQMPHVLGPYEPHSYDKYDPPGHGAVAVPVDGYHYYYTHPIYPYPPEGGPTAFAGVVVPPPQQAANVWYEGPAVLPTTSAEGGREVSATSYHDDSTSTSVGSGSWKQPRRPRHRPKRFDNKDEESASAADAAKAAESKTVAGTKAASHAQRPGNYNTKFHSFNSAIGRSNGSVTSVTSHSTATVLEESSRILPPIASIVGNATSTKGGGPKSPGKKKKGNSGQGTYNTKNKVGASGLLSEENFPALASPKGKAGTTAGESPGAAARDESMATMPPPAPRPVPPLLPYAEAAKAKKRNYHPKHKKSDSPTPRNATADDVTRDMLCLSVED